MSHSARAYAGATIVGFYGEKPADLAGWIMALQARILQEMPGFISRGIDDVHATIIGLEYPTRAISPSDVLDLTQYVAGCFKDGLDLQFGGFEPGMSAFTSRGRDPYERSFSLAGGQGIIIGWPAAAPGENQDLRNSLATVRRGAERFGFRHRYHRVPEDRDLDCYMVVGAYDEEATRQSSAASGATESAIRRYLSANPISLSLRAEFLSAVRYQSTALEHATSMSLPLSQELSSETAAAIAAGSYRTRSTGSGDRQPDGGA